MIELLTALAFPKELTLSIVGRTNKLFPTTSNLLEALAVLPILTSPLMRCSFHLKMNPPTVNLIVSDFALIHNLSAASVLIATKLLPVCIVYHLYHYRNSQIWVSRVIMCIPQLLNCRSDTNFHQL